MVVPASTPLVDILVSVLMAGLETTAVRTSMIVQTQFALMVLHVMIV